MGRNTGERFRTQKQIARDRAYLATLYVKNFTLIEMKEKLYDYVKSKGDDYTMTIQQIGYDCRQLMIEWKRDQIGTIQEMMDKDLAKLDRLENEAWEAWERSKTPQRLTKIDGANIDQRTGQMKSGSLSEVHLRTQHGDTRYLDKVMEVMRERAKMLGYEGVSFRRPEKENEKDKFDHKSIPSDMMINIANRLQGIN